MDVKIQKPYPKQIEFFLAKNRFVAYGGARGGGKSWAARVKAVLLAAGTAGKRYALPNSRIMIHQPWGGAQGTASDINIQAQEILRLRSMLNSILAQHTGNTLKKISADTERDFFMSADDAVKYGLVDQVVAKR